MATPEMNASDIIASALRAVQGASMPATQFGMSGAESAAYDANTNVQREQAGSINKAQGQLADIAAQQQANYDAFFAGVQAKETATQAKAQQIADTNAAINSDYQLGVNYDDRNRQLARAMTERQDEAIKLAEQMRYLARSPGVIGGGAARAEAINELNAQRNAEVASHNAMADALDTSLHFANDTAQRVNSAVSTYTKAELAGQLSMQQAEIASKKLAISESLVKDNVTLINQATAAQVSANNSTIAKSSSQRQIAQVNLNTQQEAARFNLGKATQAADLMLKLKDAKTNEAEQANILAIVNGGALMQTGMKFKTYAEIATYQKVNPKQVEQWALAGSMGFLGDTPYDSLVNLSDPKTGAVKLGANVGPQATKAFKMITTAKQYAMESLPTTKNAAEKAAALKVELTRQLGMMYTDPAKRAEAGLNVPPVQHVLEIYNKNPAFAQKFKLAPDTVKILSPYLSVTAAPSDAVIYDALVRGLSGKLSADQVASQVSTYFAGAATLRNAGVDGNRFGFQNEKSLVAASKTYIAATPLDAHRNVLIDLVNPTQVKNHMVRQQTLLFSQVSAAQVK